MQQTLFKCLLSKLPADNTFIFNGNYYEQTDRCTMDGSLFVVFADIFMTELQLL